MAYVTNISIGAPPLLWSSVQQAFDEINQNFLELGIALGNTLELDPLDFTNLNTSVAPNNSNEFGLGTDVKTWKNLYLTEWFNVSGSELNGLWLGSAHLKGIGSVVELPANSTVGGELIINPSNTSFKTFTVPGQSNVVADSFTSTLNLTSSTGITLTTNASTDTINIANSGVRSLTGSTHLGVSTATGEVTLTNLGVTDLVAGEGISIDNSIGTVEITNTGIRGITSGGGGITVFIDGDNIASISNTSPVTRSFATVRVPGSDDLTADTTSDILKIVSGYGIDITTSEVPAGLESEQLNISFNNRVDIIGSVFGDDSGILVDAVDGTIYGNVRATTLRTAESQIALGSDAGKTSQSTYAVAIGQEAGETTQGSSAVSIGYLSGNATQGNQAVAIGYQAGTSTQGSSGVAIGFEAGKTSQGTYGVSIGHIAGEISQGSQSIAIGAIAGQTSQGSNSIAMGYSAGSGTQGAGSIALGYTAAQITQGTSAVAIGWSAGQTNQGANAIAIGYRAGFTNQNASSIVLNASGAALDAAAAGFFVNPIRSNSAGKLLMYDTTTSEISYSSTLEFNGSTISSGDSSSVIFESPVTFQGTVSIEGDLRIRNDLVLDKRLTLAELEGVNNELNIYSDWARDTGISIYSAPGVESVTLTSNRVVGIVSGVGGTQHEWVFDNNGQIQFPDTRYQTGAAISIAELKVLVAACADFPAFKTAIAALA